MSTPTTTTVPSTTTTAPPADPTTTTTAPPAGTTTTTTVPVAPTSPPTTNQPTTTTSLAPTPASTAPSATAGTTTTAAPADDDPLLASPPIAPTGSGGVPPAGPGAPAGETATATPSQLVQALGTHFPVSEEDGPATRALSLRHLAEAIPRTLRDLVVSPFVITGVIVGAIRDTGAATIWPLVIVIPLIIDWRAMRHRFRTVVRLRTS